jgi:hypothetical protein
MELEINGSLNNKTYNHYFSRIFLLASVMYEWNLPKELKNVPDRFIEKSLFWNGKLAIFNHPQYGFMITKCTDGGKLNVYDEPVAYHCYGNNGFSYDVKAKDCVIIRNNILEIPTMYMVDLFCARIADITRTIDTNVFQQKMPNVFTCDESQRLTLKNFLMKVQGNEPYILGNKQLSLDKLDVLNTNSPYVADKLFQLKGDLWSEMLDMLGINNSNTKKKERLITDEVNSNNQLLLFESDTMLMTRQFACKEVKEKFGFDMTCELREDHKEEIESEGDGVNE